MKRLALNLSAQLGLATLIWVALTCAEIAVHAPAIDLPTVLAYLPGSALALSALFGAGVVAVHALHRALRARAQPGRALGATALVLALAGLIPVHALSASLVEGAWVAEHPHVAWIRVAIFVALELAWLLAWAFHAAGLALRGRAMRALWWALAVAALAGASFLLQGPLRAYEVLAEHCVPVAWLITLSAALRLHEDFPRGARVAGLASLALASLTLARHALDRDARDFARSETFASSSFAALAETLVAGKPSPLGRLDFEHAQAGACPEQRVIAPLPLTDAQRRNVVWISVDTLRRDAIGKRFGSRAVTPNLESFGRRSVFFSRAVAPASGTLFSLSSALTGHSVSQLLFMHRTPSNVLRRTRGALPEQHIVFPAWPTFEQRAYKDLVIQKARAVYTKRTKEGSTLAPFIAALDKARAKGARGFFWLHLVEPHHPYSKHKAFDFGESKRERYYAEVAFGDGIIGRALAHLEKHGYFEDSLIAIFSDHGEALGEAGGYYGHGVSMAATFTDIPIYVRYPGVAPRVSGAAVTLTSLAATTLHFLGLEVPASFSDCSLLEPEDALARCAMPVSTSYGLRSELVETVLRKPLRSVADIPKRQALLEAKTRFAPEIAFTTASHRYLINLKTGAERLFDRARDPNEQRNLVRREPAVAARFRDAVRRWSKAEAARIACALDHKR